MAVLWITEIHNFFGYFNLNQGDRKWKPEILGQTFDPNHPFSSTFTKWKNLPVPWVDEGALTITAGEGKEFKCVVGPSSTGKKDNDYLIVSHDGAFTETLIGPRGRDNFNCALHLDQNGQIRFEGIHPG